MKNIFFVGQAEYKTGIVLRKDLTPFVSGGDKEEIYIVFENQIEAIDYAKKMNNKNTEIEYWVENNIGKTIFYISKDEIKTYD